MLILNRPQTDPYFNIAAEEFLLKHVEDDCFMVWVNAPSVVVGKHQNTFAEINGPYVKKHSIPVVRRISGGGTVFHDPGNLNFSFIRKGNREGLVDFRRYTQPIIDYLVSLGIPAMFEGKNDIRVNGLKISGNAEHVFKDRVLHHGTLLYSSKLSQLNRAIKGQEQFYFDKAVKSVRSTVANVSDFLTDVPTIEAFRKNLLTYISSVFQEASARDLSGSEVEAIQELIVKKYITWEWNYGYSPKFFFEKEIEIHRDSFSLKMEVKEGIIATVNVENGHADPVPFHRFAGIRFMPEDLIQHYEHSGFDKFLSELEYEKMIVNLFTE